LKNPDIRNNWKAQSAEIPVIALDKKNDFVRSEIIRCTQVNKQMGITID